MSMLPSPLRFLIVVHLAKSHHMISAFSFVKTHGSELCQWDGVLVVGGRPDRLFSSRRFKYSAISFNQTKHSDSALSASNLAAIKRADPQRDTYDFLHGLPPSEQHNMFRRAKQLAFEAIRTTDLTDVEELQTIKNQREKTKEAIIANWAERWHYSLRSSMAGIAPGRKSTSHFPTPSHNTPQREH
ncbi:hypothetical protein DFH94DRAFT_683222 [Russula ochroleuca]|uniref:Uncharacterized protein n=1 Tax=Russula ochroleuca TaxID=152965 RepID=A0A9P5MT47_9AGAM|nr:hypothetical protein DFH94DRAFT_683222 [Russula ochroleuca]